MTSPRSLKTRLHDQRILLVPGVYDGLSALLAEKAGAEALYLSGASIAYTRFGRPDIGLITMTEVADSLEPVAERIAIPVIVDADDGYGNALNVQRTVRCFERAGAAALQLEDQAFPKRCGHLDGKVLIAREEMIGKIAAACDARRSDQTLIIARTDGIAVEGLEAALDRAEAYAEAGADILFVEAPRSIDEMKVTVARLRSRVPLLANMVEGGKTPAMDAQALETIGYKMVIFPGGLVRAQVTAMQAYFESLLHHGSNLPFADRMLDFAGINDVIGTDDMLALGKRFDGKTKEVE